jgi:hypothetical protein
VLDRIAPTVSPRSSIIISDEPLSRETNYRTEFVAVLNDQPQGGFITRKPTPPVRVASEPPQAYQRNGGFNPFSFFQPAPARNPAPPPRQRRQQSDGRIPQPSWW